jgi:Dynein light chain type 1
LNLLAVPAFLDGVIDYFMEAVSPDCNLESWLAPVSMQPVFKIRDIPPDIENIIVTIARLTHSKFVDDQGMAMLIRSALEKHHGYACKWHVIVGRKFGLQVDSDRGNFLFMYIGHLGFVVFRTFG